MAANVKLRADVNELAQINAELKRLNALAKPLRERKKILESTLEKYLEQVRKTGRGSHASIKLNNVEVVQVEKRQRERLKKDERESLGVQYLEQLGVRDPKRTFSQLQEMIKGSEHVVKTLQLKDPATGKKK